MDKIAKFLYVMLILISPFIVAMSNGTICDGDHDCSRNVCSHPQQVWCIFITRVVPRLRRMGLCSCSSKLAP
ncbi:putative Late nodulin [Medicago truncatula]|uniref:Nodule Cysteine-Rich (NCR) secreted peptide n=1 Tax=Medicago truncatula TaxID=3880 RepID=G7KM16_MEDTR|nr:Nodule Cysteine-Rich (NCR) secreted peptide [Medicago truncatula]RHN51636.1 putative Late nodulin [Medicago truncatula]